MCLFYAIALCFQDFDDFSFKVALNENFALFGGTADAAFVFEELGEGLEVVVGADKTLDESDDFTFALFGVGEDTKGLPVRGESLGFRLVFILILEIGIC